MLHAREAGKELTVIKKFIYERKKWENERQREAKNQTNANKKAFEQKKKERVEAEKQKEKDRLAEASKLKRQQSIAALASLTPTERTSLTETQETAAEDLPEPTAGPSSAGPEDMDVSPTTPLDVQTQEEPDDESEPEVVSPRPSKSRSGIAPEIDTDQYPIRTRRTRSSTDTSGPGATKSQMATLMASLRKMHDKQDALSDWLVKRDEVIENIEIAMYVYLLI